MKEILVQKNIPVVVPTKAFCWRERLHSFRYAVNGLKALLRHEHNTWIHAAFTLVALVFAVALCINITEWCLLLFAIAFVWTTEVINTAIEKAMDFISLEKHPQIGLVKDLAAAAVLLSAVAAALIGTLIFLPKLLRYV